ncbi:MAG TPA: hypothetical protein VJN88_03040 [Ktedonobacterales bacterium]|nr:hypothetical protein [Ktedonobacterales bacterium]
MAPEEGRAGAEGREADAERERRLAALSALARDRDAGVVGDTAATGDHASGNTGARRRWLVGVSAALVVIVVAAAVSGYLLTRPGKGKSKARAAVTPTTLTLDLTALNLYCPEALAWSPDGSRFAVLAFSVSCMASTHPNGPDTVGVFDATTGKEGRSIDLSVALRSVSGYVNKAALTWSPDGKMVAMAAYGDRPPQDLLVVASVAENTVRAYSAPLDARYDYGSASGDDLVWNVKAGAVASHITYPMPAASAYSIDATGRLVAGQALPSASGYSGYTGSPVTTGAGEYSIWQPGVLADIDNRTTYNPKAPPIYYQAGVPMWSADGTYLAADVGLGTYALPLDSAAALARNSADSCSTSQLPPCVATPIPYPDRAFERATQSMVQNTHFASFTIPVAWRPDGKLMATILPADYPTFQSGRYGVSVLRTDTGATTRMFTALTNATVNELPAQAMLAWSPNGQQLSFVDYGGSSVSVWAVAASA